MENPWDEFIRCADHWHEIGDVERLKLWEIVQNATATSESGGEQILAIQKYGRDEAQRLNEPRWVLLFESMRLSTLVADLEEYARALPLARELMVLVNTPKMLSHPFRIRILTNVVCIYLETDPQGYQTEINRGLEYLESQMLQDPVEDRFILLFRKSSFLLFLGCLDEAYQVAQGALGLAQRANRIWYMAWMEYLLCRICFELHQPDELAVHAEHLLELSKKHHRLRRTEAEAYFWISYINRWRGQEKKATRAFQGGLRCLDGLDVKDTACAEPMAACYEVVGDLQSAIGVRDRQLSVLNRNGQFHLASKAQIERCRLLQVMGTLTVADLNSARLAANKLRIPDPFLKRISELEQRQPRDS